MSPRKGKIFLLPILLGALSSVASLHHSDVYPTEIRVEEGQGFNLWLKKETDLHKCVLEFDNHQYNGTVRSLVTKFGRMELIPTTNGKECGFRVRGVTRSGYGQWSIIYYYAGREDIDNKDSANVIVSPRLVADTHCPKQEENCIMIHSKTHVEIPCKEFTEQNEDDWKCQYFVTGSMMAKVESGAKKIAIKEETSTPLEVVRRFDEPRNFDGLQHKVLECRSKELPIRSCKVKHSVSGRSFSVQVGLESVDKRYSAYKTDLVRGLCQFEISTPIQVKDVGVWEMFINGRRISSCAFLLRPEPEDVMIVKQKDTEKSATISFAKKLNYPLKRCFIQEVKKGAVMEFNYDEKKLESGTCEFVRELKELKKKKEESKSSWRSKRESSTVSEWYCGYNGPNGQEKDIVAKFFVKKFDNELIEPKVEIQRDYSLVTEVHEINGSPIKSCLVMSPEGEIFSVPADNFDDRDLPYSYHGIGFERGNCGIRIKDAHLYGGTWKFYVTTEDDKEYKLEHVAEEKYGESG